MKIPCAFPGCTSPGGAEHTCADCGRTVCYWHFADRPTGKKDPIKVCHPVCASPYWQTGCPEWRPTTSASEARP